MNRKSLFFLWFIFLVCPSASLSDGDGLSDGKVESVDINPHGLYRNTLNIEKIIFGSFYENQRVVVLSPAPQKTGIDFKEGETYRVFSVYLNGAYRTWN